MLFACSLPFSLEQGLSPDLELGWWLASPEILFPPSIQPRCCRLVRVFLASNVGVEICTQVLMLAHKALLSAEPSPRLLCCGFLQALVT